jgi:hypothetical protein
VAWAGLTGRFPSPDWPSGPVGPDEPGTFSVAETEHVTRGGDGESGAVDYALAVDSADLEVVDADPDVFVDAPRYGATTVWGSLHGDVHTYALPDDASITYLEVQGRLDGPWAVPQFVLSRAPLRGEPDRATDDWQVELARVDADQFTYGGYAIDVTGRIEPGGRMERSDGTDADGRFSGRLGDGDEDYLESSGWLRQVALRPGNAEVRVDRSPLD